MIHLSQGKLTIFSGLISIVVPFLIYLFRKQSKKLIVFLFAVCLFVIFYETLFTREMGTERKLDLLPLKSYFQFSSKYMRYQVYMNVFLFIPFGFLIPFTSKRTFFQVLLIGCCLSITIEALQYIFALGLCETDDVIHNTFGTIIGYWYWVGLNAFSRKFNIIKRGKDK